MDVLMVFHIIVSVLLVISILLQAGKGGGLAESFSAAESMFGTQTNKFMTRLTTVLTVIFLTTSLTLAFYSSKADKSLMEKAKLPPPKPVAEQPAEPIINIEAPKPLTPEDLTSESKDSKETAVSVTLNQTK